ncbi:MAG: hypothetical protein DRH15_06985 [Deltaproteobacteria bacterium]|nr:MAG: hypothetical protein DRH15_06985 [Deltaproteobacteria bacterium]
MIRCLQCGKELGGERVDGSVPYISASIIGDEYTESYYLCPDCRVYTVEIYRDRFSGEDTISLAGPISESEGRAKIEIIKQCPEPWNKQCRCKAHRSYFGKWLD